MSADTNYQENAESNAERFADEVTYQFTQWIEDNPNADAVQRGAAHKAIIHRVSIEFNAK